MSVALRRDTNTITVANFYENYLLGKYEFAPPYQRNSIWTDEKQSFFIDSILKNFPVPPIFLHQHIDDKTGKTTYDVIDGKQRLTSIIRFINNEIPVSSEFEMDEFDDERLKGAYFRDLDAPDLAEYKRDFWRYVIPIEYIDAASADVIDNVFDRLNRNGEPLNGQELRNAKYHDSQLLKLVQELADYPFWQARLEHVDLTRMENHEFISELLFVILEGGPQAALPNLLDRLYEKYRKADIDWADLRGRFLEITSFLEELKLDYEAHKIAGVSHLYGLWCFAWYCRSNAIPARDVTERLTALFVELRSNEIRNADVQEYKKTMSANTKSKTMRDRRLQILIHYCLGIN